LEFLNSLFKEINSQKLQLGLAHIWAHKEYKAINIVIKVIYGDLDWFYINWVSFNLILATAKFPYDNKSEFDLRKDFQKIGTPLLPKRYS
jgi:hypothetical protein